MTLLMQAVWDPTIDFAQWNAVFKIADENWAPFEPPELVLGSKSVQSILLPQSRMTLESETFNEREITSFAVDEIFTRKHRRHRQAHRRRQQTLGTLGGSLMKNSSNEASSALGSVEDEVGADPTLWDLEQHHTCSLSCKQNHRPQLRLGIAVTTYTVSRAWDGKRARAGSIYLTTNGMSVPPQTQRSLLMINQCDWSNFVLQYVVEAVARKIDPDITVTWKIVIPRPRYSFHIPRDANELPGETHHSVLLLVTSRGAKYIMDMSGEQFGVPRKHRFLPWQAYRKRYVVRNKYWTGRGAWILNTGDRREQCRKADKRDSAQFWSNTQQAVERACAEWNVGHDGTGEWWSEIEWMEPARYRQKASSLRSAVWRTMSTQFSPEMKGVKSS